MKKNGLILLSTTLMLFFSCSKDDNNPPQDNQADSVLSSNLHAPQITDYTQNPPLASGPFVKFDFSSGDITNSDSDWDIAFRGTTILVNGGTATGIEEAPERNGIAGAYLVNGLFSEINDINTQGFIQDGPNGLAIPTGSGNGWYTYDSSLAAIYPIPGKVLVLKTADGKYAKMEILSYYKDAPEIITQDIALEDLRYYTFNYVYLDDANATSF